MCVIFRRITCRGHVGTLASIYGVGGWSRYIRSDRVEYLVLLCPSTPPRFHLCPSFSSRRGLRRHSRSVSPRLIPLPFLSPLSSCICFLFLHSSLSLSRISIVSKRDEDQRRGNFSIVVSRIFSFSSRLRDKGWYSALENARGWKKLITVREHELEGEREGMYEKKREASRIILRMGGA